MKKKSLLVVALFLALCAGACQDHHFKSYDEMGPLPEPSPGATGGKTPPQGHARAGAGQGVSPERDTGFAGRIAAGVVDIAPGVGSTGKGWVLYVVARPAEGGPALAALRIDNVSFPARFELTEKNLMMGTPKPGMKLVMEAMYDSDGDPISKDPGDLFGKSSDAVELGAGDVIITLARRS